MAHRELPEAESSWRCAVQVCAGLLLPLELSWAIWPPPACSSLPQLTSKVLPACLPGCPSVPSQMFSATQERFGARRPPCGAITALPSALRHPQPGTRMLQDKAEIPRGWQKAAKNNAGKPLLPHGTGEAPQVGLSLFPTACETPARVRLVPPPNPAPKIPEIKDTPNTARLGPSSQFYFGMLPSATGSAPWAVGGAWRQRAERPARFSRMLLPRSRAPDQPQEPPAQGNVV